MNTQALFGQLLIGLINGSFYAILSLGLAVIFGLLNIINFTHGAQYMIGAFVAWGLLNGASVPRIAVGDIVLLPAFTLLPGGVGYWWALLLAPIIVGTTGVVIERLLLRHLYK